MANKGGRPSDFIWEHFLQVTKDGKKLDRCTCTSCGNKDFGNLPSLDIKFFTLYFCHLKRLYVHINGSFEESFIMMRSVNKMVK